MFIIFTLSFARKLSTRFSVTFRIFHMKSLAKTLDLPSQRDERFTINIENAIKRKHLMLDLNLQYRKKNSNLFTHRKFIHAFIPYNSINGQLNQMVIIFIFCAVFCSLINSSSVYCNYNTILNKFSPACFEERWLVITNGKNLVYQKNWSFFSIYFVGTFKFQYCWSLR